MTGDDPKDQQPVAAEPLTAWLESAGPSHALVIEDGSAGNASPLLRWAVGIAETGSREVIAASLGPSTGLVLERDILTKLYRQLHPDDEADAAAKLSLGRLREHVRWGLRADGLEAPRLIVLDRFSWGERSFRQNLEHLLDRLACEQKVAVSVRVEAGGEVDVSRWCELLGWRLEETLLVTLPAGLDEELPPMARARRQMDACGSGEGATTAGVLDVLAGALRPMRLEEVAALSECDLGIVTASLRAAHEVAIDVDGGWIFREPTVARAWAALRGEASERVRGRMLALGEAALSGGDSRIPPYVIEHYGLLLGQRGGSKEQVALVGEAWASAWSSLDGDLGFEADVERVAGAARRELLSNALGPAEHRAEAIVTLFRCMLVSSSVEHRVSGAGSVASTRAEALARLAEELEEPQRAFVRERAVDIALGADTADLDVSALDVLVRLAPRFEGKRRAVIVESALEWCRAEAARGGIGTWILRVAPALSSDEQGAVCDEVKRTLHELSEYDASILRDALDAAPSLAPRLADAIVSLSGLARFRLACALAPHLEGEQRKQVVREIVSTAENAPFPTPVEDLEYATRAFEAADLVRLWPTVQRATGADHHARLCLRPLFRLGAASEAESLSGADIEAMPFDWVLALAAVLGDQRPDLRAELGSRIDSKDEITLGWTIDRDAVELVRAFGVDDVVRLARTISSDEERIVARLAIAPLAPEAERRALISEAVRVFRESVAGGDLHWRELLSSWAWMSIPDACYLLVQVPDHPANAPYGLEDIGSLVRRIGGDEMPARIAEQIIEVSRWCR